MDLSTVSDADLMGAIGGANSPSDLSHISDADLTAALQKPSAAPTSTWQDTKQALQTGITRLPLGIMQAESEGLSRGADALGMPEIAGRLDNTANIMKQVAADQAAKGEAAKTNSPITATAANLIPQIGQLAGFGASLPGLAAAGFTAGAAGPKLSQQDLQNANYQPANTYFDRAMNTLAYLPRKGVELAGEETGFNPNSRFAQGLTGALTGAEGYGISKAAGNTIGNLASKDTTPTPAQLEAAIAPAYDKATKSGQVFAPDDLANKFSQDVNSAIPKPSSNGQLLEGDNYLNNILQKYTGYENKPLGIAEADKIDKDLTGNIQRAYKAGYNNEANQLGDIQDNFRNQMNQAPAGADLNQARSLAAANFKMRDLQAIQENADSANVPSTAIKTGANTLYKRIQKNPGGWTDDEISAIDNARKTGLLTGALNTVGSKLISGVVGGTAGLFGGGLHGALAGAAAGEAAGFPLRAGANAIQRGKLNNVMNTVAQRPAVQAAFPAPQPNAASSAISGAYSQVPRLGAVAPNPQQTEQGSTAATQAQQQSFADQVKAPDVTSFIGPESGGNPNAKNPNSTATGPYQFTNKTWANMVMKYGKQSGIGTADKSNPQAQATMARLYALDNIDTLRPSLGRDPTKGELYMAHLFGADGAKKLITAPPNKEAVMLFPRNVIDGNYNIFFDKQTKQPRTASQVYALLDKKVN